MSKKNKIKKEVVEAEVLIKDAETNEKVETKKDPLEIFQAELDKEKDRNLRLFAEFENYKKRTGRERIELFKTASTELMTAILPVLDDFDRALSEIDKNGDENLLKGVTLISSKLRETLKSKGLEEIETTPGTVFNADIHEAITQIPAPDKKLKGKIIEVIEKGYSLGEKIIRFPKVIIGQ